jgi:pimeloyl-ACP methyl ester carboxylesterase
MQAIQPQEHWIAGSNGRLYAKSWHPAANPPTDAAPIVLFHDSLGCVALWRDFPERLASTTTRTVIAYDRLGFGRSDPHPHRLDKHFIHDEAGNGFRALRQQLGFEAFIALGHSVGGGMAVACAAAYPRDCRALITISAQAFVEDRTIEGIVQAREGFRQPGQLDRLRKYHGDKAAWVLSAWIDTWLAPDFADWTLDGDLQQVRCPALVIHGDRDEYGSARHPERIARLSGGPAVVRMLPQCGHVPYREKAEEVLDLVERQVRALQGPAP